MKITNLPCCAAIIGLICLPSTPLWGEDLRSSMTFEANYTKGADLAVGSPKEARLSSTAVVSDGQLEVLSDSEGVEYGVTLKEYLDVSGSSWGSNTLAGVFLLHTSSAKARQTLFSTGNSDSVPPIYDNQSGILLLANNDSPTGGPNLALSHDWKSLGIGIDDFKPVPGVWYFLAASWRDTGDEDIDFRIYLRALDDTDGSEAIYKTSSQSRISPGMTKSADQIVAIGNRLGDRKNAKMEPFNGAVRLFQIHNVFLDDQNAFSSLFDAAGSSLK
jgi:hypothetical protein